MCYRLSIVDDALEALPPEAEAKLRALQAQQAARREAEADDRRARRSLWLTHHWPNEYDRCSVIGGRHVCRRCLTLYPIAILVAIVGLAGFVPWPDRIDVWMIWLLCIPATVEFLAEKLVHVAYSPRRQIVVTALVGLALGRGLSYEIDDRWSWEFWGPVLVFCTIWFVAAGVRAQRDYFEQALELSVEFGPASEAPGSAETDASPG